jgi:hypothetical protein
MIQILAPIRIILAKVLSWIFSVSIINSGSGFDIDHDRLLPICSRNIFCEHCFILFGSVQGGGTHWLTGATLASKVTDKLEVTVFTASLPPGGPNKVFAAILQFLFRTWL